MNYYTFVNKKTSEWHERFEFNNGDIPLVDYGPELGLQYNPVTVEQYALVVYNNYLATGSNLDLELFKKLVANLMSKVVTVKENCRAVPYAFMLKRYNLEAPWFSGMESGQFLSVMTRAHFLGLEIEANVFKEIVNFMKLPVQNGGVLRLDKDENMWIEEFPEQKSGTFVLNGFLFSVVGLLEYQMKIETNEELELFILKLINSLKKRIKIYEKYWWLLYQDYPNEKDIFVSNEYMKMQALQMKHIYMLTNDHWFLSKYYKYISQYYLNPIKIIRHLPNFILDKLRILLNSHR